MTQKSGCMSHTFLTVRSLFLRWGSLRLERVVLGVIAAFCFLWIGYFVFAHRCGAGSKLLESVIPWVVAASAYVVVTRLRVWAALLGLVVLVSVLACGSALYIKAIHHGSPSECLKHSA